MNAQDDRDFLEWQTQWQAAEPRDVSTEEQIRHYVKRRTGLLWSWFVAEFIVGGMALPVLAYLAWMSEKQVERFAMLGLTSITLATIMFGFWNYRGILRSSAQTVTEYIAISAERLRRMRQAWRVGWIILAGQVTLFAIWIWDRLYSGDAPVDPASERFAWVWLAAISGTFVVYLIVLGRWITRDAKRFERLRLDLE